MSNAKKSLLEVNNLSVSFDTTEGSFDAVKSVNFDLKKGETISTKDIRSVRPGYGLHPKYFDEILGKKVIENVEKGDRVNFDIIK